MRWIGEGGGIRRGGETPIVGVVDGIMIENRDIEQISSPALSSAAHPHHPLPRLPLLDDLHF